MTEIVNLEGIVSNLLKQKKTLQETAADLGATILEMKREEEYYGKDTRRMAELKMLAEAQKLVLTKMMDRGFDDTRSPGVPHLKVVK